ncbi:methyltransferase domain-containing protein [Paludibaculum fermentans]|uniref:Methyltransferase domain-containing protein n=1 Tax=Paludibaculum fermentans TaxID=1473598 RepID=A0A7S7SPB1_PALFE|nr:methyltransferase domain-containing protein [Paludibaculum fermentans]QOY91718.1 methyltransferase domain-containing protein [Paludibaculum fermentans]
MHAQSHRSDARILGRRTLEQDHRHLARLLRPGLSVLDVGCAAGAITAGIAKAVGSEGQVVGVDRDPVHLESARVRCGDFANLHFEQGDATTLDYPAQFDVVTAARTLQWIAEPGQAVAAMARAVKPGGLVVILDYNHADNAWDPAPPGEFQRFYQAFLDWRQAHHLDNRMADHLPALLEAAGLVEVETHLQDEVSERGQPDFPQRTTLWVEVIDSVGAQVAQGGFFPEAELPRVRSLYSEWVRTELIRQTLAMRTVTGRRP